MSKVLVVGGGAAGMMAAIAAAEKGHQVSLYEKNEKLGKKLFITGKGRCNLTNAVEVEELLSAVLTNRRFLYSAFYGFTNQQVMDFFTDNGVPLKVERGNRVFPASDHSSDIIRGLQKRMEALGVRICLNTTVDKIVVKDEQVQGIKVTSLARCCSFTPEALSTTGTQMADQEIIEGDACIIATGGLSYPSTGSTGDGYRFAKKVGHKVTELLPGLVSLEAKEWYVKQLQGLSLRNVSIQIVDGKKKLYEDFGEMLFTHYGVSGPLLLSASSVIGKRLQETPLFMTIDLKAALTFEQLDKRLLKEFQGQLNRQFKNALNSLFPAKLEPIMVELSGIPEEKRVHEVTKEERQRFVHLIKTFPVTLTGLRGFQEAIITKGGIDVKEINPATMESKLVKGLYFAGEVLDLDAVTGGFNLQIAWSTGYLAGMSV